MSISRCSRCGDLSYEQLATHGYCVNCNYSHDLVVDETSLATLAAACRRVDHQERLERSSVRFQEALKERTEMESEVC
jgi:hypothetical protein